jgi:hypothetical protein
LVVISGATSMSFVSTSILGLPSSGVFASN